METTSWLDLQIQRNLSERAEHIMAEIHGLPEPEREEVPDSPFTFAEISAATVYARMPRKFKRAWEAK